MNDLYAIVKNEVADKKQRVFFWGTKFEVEEVYWTLRNEFPNQYEMVPAKLTYKGIEIDE